MHDLDVICLEFTGKSLQTLQGNSRKFYHQKYWLWPRSFFVPKKIKQLKNAIPFELDKIRQKVFNRHNKRKKENQLPQLKQFPLRLYSKPRHISKSRPFIIIPLFPRLRPLDQAALFQRSLLK